MLHTRHTFLSARKIFCQKIPNNKASEGDKHIDIFKHTYLFLTDRIYDAMTKGIYPDIFQIANITPVHKKDEPTDKEHYRLKNVSSLLSKVFERLIYDQLSELL